MAFYTFMLPIGIGLAGAAGAVTRYLVGRFIVERTSPQFPFGTLFINITGAFVIGLLSALTTRKLLAPALQGIFATGFLGGYTTFSTMSWEGIQLARGGVARLSFFYIAGSVALGLLAATGGLGLGWILS